MSMWDGPLGASGGAKLPTTTQRSHKRQYLLRGRANESDSKFKDMSHIQVYISIHTRTRKRRPLQPKHTPSDPQAMNIPGIPAQALPGGVPLRPSATRGVTEAVHLRTGGHRGSFSKAAKGTPL